MTNQFLTNYTDLSFLSKIKENLKTCTSFNFSVSFIKKAGLVLLFNDIEEALYRGVKGRIITSTYQNFTDIESLRMFARLMEKYNNFECHLDHDCFYDQSYSKQGFHTKGYLFTFKDHVEVVVGSSNITRFALLKNIEWDLSITESTPDVYENALQEYEMLWNKTLKLSTELIKTYSEKINYSIERWDMDYEYALQGIKPNYMQRKALKELNRYRAQGVSKALVIAAAGSGKTYLAAFDALNFSPKRLLYIVHEGSILKKSLETFNTLFGDRVTYGMLTGKSKETEADFIFSTNITMCNSLDMFAEDEFDYIIIDECHHAAAETYRKIISYFKPEFLIGLTATPERMDDQNIYELFDQNVPFELRLRDAIVNSLVVPFKYYGIRDKIVDYGLTKSEERKLISQLASVDHVDFICEQIEHYRGKGKLKALAFCRNITHARMMCEAMSDRYKTAYLTAKNNVGERIRAYNDLQDDVNDLEILFTVDILNEGVDIPGVNMVLFLRPTESSTIFIQQLGRGLRKYPDKDYVTVLDFIGNSYKRSVQIAFALGSLSSGFVMEKNLLKSLVKDDFIALNLADYGVTINIDSLSKEEIISYLENENFNKLAYLEQDYKNFKKYINAEYPPCHMDYLNSDYAPDLIRFLNVKGNGKKNVSYYNFLKSIGEEAIPTFSDQQVKFINYVSSMLPLVRKHEYLIIDSVINGTTNINEVSNHVLEMIENSTMDQIDHALKYMYESGFVKIEDDNLILDVLLDAELNEYITDLIKYGLSRHTVEYGNTNGFVLWNNYRMDQVQQLFLKNPKNNQVGTYYYDNDVIIFASLKKDASVEERHNYKDKFLSKKVFQWETMADVSQKHVQKQINSDKAYVFVRKVSEENGIVLPFTYVGCGKMANPREQTKFDVKKGKKVNTYLYDIILENELPNYLEYDFDVKEQTK